VTALLFSDSEWSFDRLKATYNAIEDIALNDLKLDVDPHPIAGFVRTDRP
jgi:stage V sporulation protein R